MSSRRRLLAISGAVLSAAALALVGYGTAAPGAHAFDYNSLSQIQKRILSGYSDFELNPALASDGPNRLPANYYPRGSDTCPVNLGSNIKVNQNCLNLSDPDLQGRAQAENETAINADPAQPNHLIAMSNDYRYGDGNCFPSYSLDDGRTWNDTVLPSEFTRGTAFGAQRQYWQTCGDPFVLGYDTYGNAYVGELSFNRGAPTTSNPDTSSAVYVFRSTGNNGASWNFPGRPVVELSQTTGAGGGLEDKPYGTVDNHPTSPFVNRLYVTWTEFAPDGTAYILEAYSADYGEHFSAPHLVSINTPYCPVTYGLPTPRGNCNENQFSQPFTGPDGTLYVVFDNYNNATKGPTDNRNQVLLARSTDGGNTFTYLQKVADYYDLPDCATYQQGQDFGRACVPEKAPTANSIFRATNYPSGVVDPTDPSRIAVTFGSYINPHSNESNGCVPAGVNPATGQDLYTGVKTPGACNNDILLSVSTDGGTTFTGTTIDPRALTSVTTDPGQATTDQFWQWADYTKTGKLAVSYYDRQYDTDETTGYSDVSLSGTGDLASFVVDRVTSSPNPPPTEFSGLFMGDYSGLVAVNDAHPLWTDTRDPDLFICPATSPPAVCAGSAPNAPLANDQDIFTANLPVPAR